MDAGLFAADFSREKLLSGIAAEAAQNVFIGTSSWKYPGWIGMLYDEQRYLRKKRFSKAAFERECLQEYAEVFPTVCVDAGFYQYPQERQVENMVSQVPATFRFAFKVTELLTIKHFTKLPRHAARAGEVNDNFLNAGNFQRQFLTPLTPFQDSIGVLIFSFTQFSVRDFRRGREFVQLLDGFLRELPHDWQYAIEIRNKNFLQEEYFEVLERHNVAHVFNSWSRMPSVLEQLALKRSHTADFNVGRFLLKPGRTYEQAVKNFAPYKKTGEVYADGRNGLSKLIKKSRANSNRKSFIFVNNRLEGNALQTILSAL
ncbi:MAG: DUF72 domain-containing protein [Chthoniobacterales bacterium]